MALGVPEPGLVAEVLVKVDAEVKKDQELLRLDDRQLQAQLPGLRAKVSQCTVRLDGGKICEQSRRLLDEKYNLDA